MKTTTTKTIVTKNIKNTVLALTVSAIAMASTSAQAGKHNHQSKHYDNIDYAKVVDVYPVTKQIKVSEPVHQCYDKKVWHEAPRRHHHSHKNEIVGALIGAAVGNRVGKRVGGRNGRDIATAAGAVIGGVVGHDRSRKHNRHNSSGYYKVVQHCDTHNQVSYEQKIVAYKVTYKYRGQTYKTRTKFHPGDRLKVRVNVTPVGYS